MAITETRTLPAEFIETLGKDYAAGLTNLTGTPIDTSKFAPTVASQDALQTQAASLAGQGVGSYQPFLTAADTAGTAAGTALTGAQGILGTAGTELSGAGTALGTAGTTIGGVSPFISAAGTGLGTAAGLTGTGTGTGTGSIASYMSPYQSQVIDATLADYDTRVASQRSGVTQQAGLGTVGNLDSGRFGVQLGAFDAQTARDRALIEANLLQQGFGQASQARQSDLQNQLALSQGQLGLGQAQLGLGQAQAGQAGQQAGFAGQRAAFAQQQAGLGQAQLGLGQFQQGLGGTTQALGQSDVSLLGQVGATQQAQTQAQADALRESNRLAAYEPYERIGFQGSGVTGLMGGYPAQYQFTSQPNPTPLQTALGTGATLAGIYGAMQPRR
tara:strand:+ start:73 stop:1233 length:1161 start_codon:yes stop_codon:yes gene_type:complete